MRLYKNHCGAALTFVIIILILLAGLVGYLASISYNERLMKYQGGGKRAKIVYYAQAGIIDAMYRIRENVTSGLAPAPPVGGFNDLITIYDPDPYWIDVDQDGTNDVQVNITVPITTTVGGITFTARQINSMAPGA